ncbi:MAG: hypothetical protein KKA81_15110 [Bacteroidetes bacterium]|nr:hypothetical protein [Bacteroidota bacterium]
MKKSDSIDDLFERLEQLICLPLAGSIWNLVQGIAFKTAFNVLVEYKKIILYIKMNFE